jgi:hypothetical protein
VRFFVPELPQCSADELAAAVRRAILQAAAQQPTEAVVGRLPRGTDLPTDEDLARAAQETAEPTTRAGDIPRADRALALLEGAYLVAATDGLEPGEREAVGALIARVLGTTNADSVSVLLESLDSRLEKEGIAERMKQVAACFGERVAREGALGFAALLALADRRLAIEEQQALIALGAALDFTATEVQMVVHKVALRLEDALAAVSRST